jgi:hypothetical protein
VWNGKHGRQRKQPRDRADAHPEVEEIVADLRQQPIHLQALM